jgi:hypothetical protein
MVLFLRVMWWVKQVVHPQGIVVIRAGWAKNASQETLENKAIQHASNTGALTRQFHGRQWMVPQSR